MASRKRKNIKMKFNLQGKAVMKNGTEKKKVLKNFLMKMANVFLIIPSPQIFHVTFQQRYVYATNIRVNRKPEPKKSCFFSFS